MKRSIRIRNVMGKYNPLAIRRRKNMQDRLLNKDFSLFTPNCIGGELCHDLNVGFNSPTVNLMMLQTDFFEFIVNLKEYLASELLFFHHPEYSFPCAKLINGMNEITLHFTHYTSEEEARNAWERRKQRINWDNIFVLIQERDGLTKEQIIQLGSVEYIKAIAAFTYQDYPDIPYSVYLKKYAKEGEVGAINKRSWIDDHREYEEYFDFVRWFNESDGTNYDVSQFAL